MKRKCNQRTDLKARHAINLRIFVWLTRRDKELVSLLMSERVCFLCVFPGRVGGRLVLKNIVCLLINFFFSLHFSFLVYCAVKIYFKVCIAKDPRKGKRKNESRGLPVCRRWFKTRGSSLRGRFTCNQFHVQQVGTWMKDKFAIHSFYMQV